MIDLTFYTLVVHFISDPMLNFVNFDVHLNFFNGMDHEKTIDLSIDYLPTNPSNDELLDTLSALLMWVSLFYSLI